ncbi:MAG: DNA alkylation repair protein [Patescibacteria group bacterium]|nr:DNA alkylation repair protein [Patescibacteria group bacterium]
MKINYLNKLIKDLEKLADKEKAKVYQRFFKTGKGEYGEGDKFLGLTVPQVRMVSKRYVNELSLDDLKKLLQNKIHEYRLSALLILRFKYEKADEKTRDKIVNFYLKNTSFINNWDLVDLSCHYILGNWLLNKKRNILYNLVNSKNLWERRIAVVSTFEFIKNNDFKDTLKIAEILLNDKHDLIHKAVGWMLREIGKRNKELLVNFLNKNYQKMPRVMLRYALEKFNEKEKKKYLKK